VQILVLIGVYFLKWTKFDQLILRKIIKIVATRFHILTLKCTKIDFGWRSTPDPGGGSYSDLPRPLAEFKGPTYKGRAGGGEGRGGEGRGAQPVWLLVLTWLRARRQWYLERLKEGNVHMCFFSRSDYRPFITTPPALGNYPLDITLCLILFRCRFVFFYF